MKIKILNYSMEGTSLVSLIHTHTESPEVCGKCDFETPSNSFLGSPFLNVVLIFFEGK